MTRAHIPPNWSESVVETLEFKTTIFITSNGQEQRSAERQAPRRSIRFSALLNQSALRLTQALLHTRGNETLEIADPARLSCILQNSATAGTVVLQVSSVPSWVATGVEIALSERQKSVFGVVASKTASTITLTSGLAKPVSAGALIRPVVEGRIDNQNTFSATTDQLANLPMTIQEVPGRPFISPGGGSLQTFEGRPVLSVGPNWQSGTKATIETAVETVDFDRGVWRDYLSHDLTSTIAQFDYLGRSSDTIGQVANLFVAMKGRLGEFWCPSWLEDMVPVSGITSGSSEITVEGRHFADFYAGLRTHKAIAIRISDGTWVFRRVSGILVNGLNPGQFTADFSDDFANGESIIQVTTPFDTTVELPEDYSTIQLITPLNVSASRLEIVGVYWLHLCRFASDQLVIRWVTDDVGQTTAQIKTIEYFAPEVT